MNLLEDKINYAVVASLSFFFVAFGSGLVARFAVGAAFFSGAAGFAATTIVT